MQRGPSWNCIFCHSCGSVQSQHFFFKVLCQVSSLISLIHMVQTEMLWVASWSVSGCVSDHEPKKFPSVVFNFLVEQKHMPHRFSAGIVNHHEDDWNWRSVLWEFVMPVWDFSLLIQECHTGLTFVRHAYVQAHIWSWRLDANWITTLEHRCLWSICICLHVV